MATANRVRLLAVLLTCALGTYAVVFVVPPKVGQAAPPVKKGKIVYTSSESRPGYSEDIYTINPTGGKPLNVTNNNTTSDGYPAPHNPDYSPDGNRIAYDELAPPKDGVYDDGEIYTIDATGGPPFQVTNNTTARSPREPSYSPDGTKIAYTGHDGNDWEIYTINATGGTPFQVTDNTEQDRAPDWSPDGTKIAYEGLHGGDFEIFTINATGGTPVNVTNNTTYEVDPSYSPDGTKIAYEGFDGQGGDGEIYTINATGGTPFQVTNNDEWDLEPSYSPDGKKLAYLSHDETDWEIYTVDAIGGKPFQVTNNTTTDYSPSWGSGR